MAKILVVDDEQVLVKGIKFNLEHEGYQVEAGYDGEQAVELARDGGFDLIILDLMMPKIDGLQACMRQHPGAEGPGEGPSAPRRSRRASGSRGRAYGRPHPPGYRGPGRLEGGGAGGSDRQGV